MARLITKNHRGFALAVDKKVDKYALYTGCKHAYPLPRRSLGKGGFVLLFALLVSSVLLTLGIGIGNIVRKQLQFASIGKSSLVAFYAADSGVECALLNRDKFLAAGTAPSGVLCAGVTMATPAGSDGYVGYPLPSAYNAKTYDFTFNLDPVLGDDGPCAKITIKKETGSTARTFIESHGYNTCSNTVKDVVERALYVRI